MRLLVIVIVISLLIFWHISKSKKEEKKKNAKAKESDLRRMKYVEVYDQIIEKMVKGKKSYKVIFFALMTSRGSRSPNGFEYNYNNYMEMKVWRENECLCFVPIRMHFEGLGSGDIVESYIKSSVAYIFGGYGDNDEEFKKFVNDIQNFKEKFDIIPKIPIDQIIYCGCEGGISREYNPVDGKGFSTKGAIVGGAIAGTAGALVGGMRNTTPSTFTLSKKDDSHVVLLCNPKYQRTVGGYRFSKNNFNVFYELIPEKCKI